MRAVTNQMSELSIGYPHCPLTRAEGHGHSGPAAGERAPVSAEGHRVGSGDRPRFVLFAVADEGSAALIARHADLLEAETRAPFADDGHLAGAARRLCGDDRPARGVGQVGAYLDWIAGKRSLVETERSTETKIPRPNGRLTLTTPNGAGGGPTGGNPLGFVDAHGVPCYPTPSRQLTAHARSRRAQKRARRTPACAPKGRVVDRFLSHFIHRFDAKGRISIPSAFRQVLAKDGFAGVYAYPSLDRAGARLRRPRAHRRDRRAACRRCRPIRPPATPSRPRFSA